MTYHPNDLRDGDTVICARGCARADGSPYLATHGAYCGRCWGRLDSALASAAELTWHLIGNAITTSGGNGEKVDASKEAPVPFNQAAFDDANELYSLLVYWADVWAGHLHNQTITADGWRTQNGTIVGFPATVTPRTASEAVGRLAAWVRHRLDMILASPHRDDIDALDEAVRDVWRMNARWPRVEQAAYSAMPCPREDCKQPIAVWPPTFPGDTRRIVCKGGHWYPEEEYEHLILVFQETAREHKRVERTVARLAKKYGIGGAA